MSNRSTFTYPRTGKRGVPQQFPRRLYEMLESEAKLAAAKPEEEFVISWSDSGKAFRITDVDEFATTVLPRYFRTKKFSSFQRNLNLVSAPCQDPMYSSFPSLANDQSVVFFSMDSPKYAEAQKQICTLMTRLFVASQSNYQSFGSLLPHLGDEPRGPRARKVTLLALDRDAQQFGLFRPHPRSTALPTSCQLRRSCHAVQSKSLRRNVSPRRG